MGEVSSALSSSRKGSDRTIRVMNANDTAREARSRNLARLRRLTIGTAALSVAATGAFSFLAAATYTGSITSAVTAAYTTSGAAGSSSSSTTTSGATLASGTSSTAATTPAVTSGSGVAHVASGGS
jgi:hypothetical protein